MGFTDLFPNDTLKYSYDPDRGILTFQETDNWVYDTETQTWSGSYKDINLTEVINSEAVLMRLPGQADFTPLFYSVEIDAADGVAEKPTEPSARQQTLAFRVLLEDYTNIEMKRASAPLTLSRKIATPFEYIILSDKDHTCYLPYNAKISSIKTNILETKTDTIMGGYPFFVRNGNVAYKEMPISALLSRQNDFLNSFGFTPEYTAEQFSRIETPEFRTFKAISPQEDVYLERRYKMAVEAWMRNGQPKVLQSPMEGNYIVRLQNVSMSPNDQLARRLHSVSATAVEVAEFNIDNLNDLGLSYLIPLERGE